MKFEPGYLIGMAMQSVAEPRKVAREVQALRFARGDLWQGFALFWILSTGLGIAGSIFFPADPEVFGPVFSSPVIMGILEGSLLVLTVHAIYWIGHAFGGAGRFDQAILTIIWLQFVMFLLQLVMLALLMFAPLLAGLLQLAAFGLTFWLLSHFIAEMHGFQSVGLVFTTIILTLIGAAFGFVLILALIGVSVGSAGAL